MSDKDEEIAELKRRLAELERRDVTPGATATTPTAGGGFKGGFFGCFGVIAAVVLVGAVLAAIGSSGRGPTTTNTTSLPEATPAASTTTANTSATTASAAASPNWTYDTDTDKLTDKPSKTACSVSTNEVSLSFPYSDSHVRLCVRRDPRYGLDVFARLEGSGQILCRSYEDCIIMVRFDGDKPVRYAGAGPSDNSTETVFLKPAARFIGKLKTSKHVVVALPLYQAGDQPIEWNTAGLDWK